jgi:NADH-ubiquinone oxidoreductase chain 4L
MTWALTLFIIGLVGFILNRKNVILMLVSIEIMLLAVTLIILISSISFNDNLGQLFALFVIALAGAESAIGLSILVVYYKLTGAVSLTKNIDVNTYKS